MKRYFVMAMFLLTIFAFAKIGGSSALQGYISSIEVKDEVTIATLTIKDVPAADLAAKVKPGMSVRIIHSIETAQFRLPIGRILTVNNGVVTAAIDKNLLEQEFEDPYTKEKIKVKTLFVVGAEVSVSGEAT